MNELLWFRITLLAVVVLVLGAGAVFASCKVGEIRASEQALAWGKRNVDTVSRCLERYPGASAEYCRNDHYENIVTRYVDGSREHETHATYALCFLVPLPVGLVLLFYGLRWAILGRLKPLWLLGGDD